MPIHSGGLSRFLLGLLVCAPCMGAAGGGERLLIRDVTLYDGSGRPARHGASVLVNGGRIEKILGPGEESGQVSAVFEASGKTLIPGLVDLQVHLTSPAIYLSGWVPSSLERHAAALLRTGVTTVLSTGAPRAESADLVSIEAIEGAGLRVLYTGPCIVPPGGRLPWIGGEALPVVGPEEAGATVAKLAVLGLRFMEIIWDDLAWTGLTPAPMLADETVASLIEQAHTASMRVVVWSRTSQTLARAAVLGADLVAGLPLVGGYDERFDQVLRDEGAVLVPGLAAVEARFAYFDDLERIHDAYYTHRVDRLLLDVVAANRYEMVDRQRGRPAGLARRVYPGLAGGVVASLAGGLRLALGSFSGEPLAFHGTAPMRELALWMAHGIPAEKAIHAATEQAARVLGLDGEVGSVVPGKVANLVVLNGDPARDPSVLRRVVAVLVGGVSLDLARLGEVLHGPSSARVTDPAPELAEDFEADSLDKMMMRAQLFDDRQAGGNSTVGMNLVADAGGRSALHMEASLRPVTHVNAFAAVQLSPREDPPVPWDVSRWRGLRVRCRGTEVPFVLLISTYSIHDGNDYRVTFKPRTSWSELRIPFTSFSQRHPGRQVRWTGKDLKAIRFLIETDTPQDVFFDLAEVGFYE